MCFRIKWCLQHRSDSSSVFCPGEVLEKPHINKTNPSSTNSHVGNSNPIHLNKNKEELALGLAERKLFKESFTFNLTNQCHLVAVPSYGLYSYSYAFSWEYTYQTLSKNGKKTH